jgi:hypothetical protein
MRRIEPAAQVVSIEKKEDILNHNQTTRNGNETKG